MKHQPPSSNNPANPLIKVASLDIEKISNENDARGGKIIAEVTFKSSDSVQGRTTSKSGQMLVLTFHMAIRKAQFELTFQTDDGRSANNLVKLSKVAYVQPLAVPSKIAASRSKTKETACELSGGGGVSAKLGMAGILPSISAAAKAIGKRKTSSKDRLKQSIKYTKMNISATFGGGYALWEISPPDVEGSLGYLEGNLFLGGRGVPIAACHFRRKDKEAISSIAIRGEIKVRMSDLILGPVSVTNELGEPASFSTIENSSGQFSLVGSEAKKRLLKEIIRKHLMQQGMKDEGDVLSVSEANT